MTGFSVFDRRPIVVAIAGPNGAGKTTFYHSHLADAGLHFVNADVLAVELDVGPYQAADVAAALRMQLLASGESFIFETVFSDPVHAKVAFLEEAVSSGHEVVVCFIGLSDVGRSIERVAMRQTQGGHDVPEEKLLARFPRVLRNLVEAIRRLPHVFVFDNSDLRTPFRLVASFSEGQPTLDCEPPSWLTALLEDDDSDDPRSG